MKRSLRTHLLAFYVLLVLFCLIATPWVISVIMGSEFDVYIQERATQEQQEITKALRDIYVAESGWNLFRVNDIARQWLRGPLMALSLSDKSGGMVWSARRRGMQIVSWQRMAHTIYPESSLPDYPSSNSRRSLKRQTFPVIVDGKDVGVLEFVSVPLPEGVEAQFLSRFHSYMYMAVSGMIVIAAVMSFVAANSLSRPILRAARRAREISEGGYRASDGKGAKAASTNVVEIENLADSLESLARSLDGQETLRKRLMSDVAHELRTPVTIIKAQVEAMADGVMPAGQANFAACVREADRLTKLIANVENLTNIEGDSLVLKKEVCDVSGLLSDLADSFSILFSDAGISLERDIAGGLFTRADGDKIKQVFDNLLSNALRYTDAGGTVRLAARCEDGGKKNLIITVSDTGIGISERDLPNIFDRFYRADASRARDTGGRGLGLSIARAIVTAHNGTIAACAGGGGSAFTVKLPGSS